MKPPKSSRKRPKVKAGEWQLIETAPIHKEQQACFEAQSGAVFVGDHEMQCSLLDLAKRLHPRLSGLLREIEECPALLRLWARTNPALQDLLHQWQQLGRPEIRWPQPFAVKPQTKKY